MSDADLYWLALRMTPGLGNRKAGQLIEIFKSPRAIFEASKQELEAAGLPAAVAQSVASGCAFDDAADQQQKVREQGVSLIALTDPQYPPLLRQVYDAPPLLYCLGRVELLDSVMLGVVGTRRPTAYGVQAATRISRDLAEAGMTITSGMARGIDTAAHKAVLEAEGNTIAVFGCGVDQIYPAENRKLAEQIISRGLIVSDFPMEAPPFPQNFPIRNRIISGMGVGVLVVEGSEYSGSAITAKLASEQNRAVFAVPGNITSKMSWGPNLLIKQGAKLVQEWNDVAVELDAGTRRRLIAQHRKSLIQEENNPTETISAARTSVMGSSPISSDLAKNGSGSALDLAGMTASFMETAAMETSASASGTAARLEKIGIPAGLERTAPAVRSVLRLIQPDAAIGLDYLVENVEGSSPSEVIAILFELELAGLVRQLPGKSYIRVWAD